jgi:transposase
MEKHAVTLSEKDRRTLVAIVTKGRNKAAFIQRAHILLKSADGKTDAEISQWLYVSESTVRRTRVRFGEAGLEAALNDQPHAETEPTLSEAQEAHLVALTCSTAPAGRERWTLELLAQQLVQDGIVTRISPETVRLVLKKNISNPGKFVAGAFLE